MACVANVVQQTPGTGKEGGHVALGPTVLQAWWSQRPVPTEHAVAVPGAVLTDGGSDVEDTPSRRLLAAGVGVLMTPLSLATPSRFNKEWCPLHKVVVGLNESRFSRPLCTARAQNHTVLLEDDEEGAW